MTPISSSVASTTAQDATRPLPISELAPQVVADPLRNAEKAHSASPLPRPAEPTPKMLEAAREFEAVFLRTLLGSLEKTTKMGGGSPLTAGQSTYGSMVVGAMTEAMSNAGGIGLAGVVAQALSAQANTEQESKLK